MLPANTVFPEFVPDQVLTSDNLNQLFGYLDEQGRMTRTNLIGIGIVCGLEVQTNASGTAITITKGCGVTSEGYLVAVPTITYTEFNTFDAVKERYYDRFVNIASTTQKFDLWELKQAGVDPDATDLSAGFLDDKVVMIFVELLEEENKNCDPNSCDDKGINVTVTFRPLLVTKTDALTLIGATGAVTADTFIGLPELKMPRFDVPNTRPVTSRDIFDAYKSILNNTFLSSVENALTQSYTSFSVFVSAEFPSNPFAGLASSFGFINGGGITQQQLIHIQYYYDLFSDFILAYDEFRKTGTHILSVCCPDSSLFPRHLLLGEAIPLPANVKSGYRHYFIYSPLFEYKNLLLELKSLFRRLVLLRNRFISPPPVSSPTSPVAVDPAIRITPSKLNDVPLSAKAIPYYYNVTTGTQQLYKFWNFAKTIRGSAHRNLSYHAGHYNSTDDYVINPLKYDLEPYNFLRIEGIIGKSYVSVLRNLKKQISQYRLPFNLIALSTDDYRSLKGITSDNISEFSVRDIDKDLLKMLCHFQDLEAMYESMKNEMLCTLCKELKYYYDLRMNFFRPKTGLANDATGTPSRVSLFEHCNPGYMVLPQTFGFLIEKVYDAVGDDGAVTIEVIAEALGLEDMINSDTGISAGASQWLGYVVIFFEIPIYIIRLSHVFTNDLNTFDVDEYCRIHKILSQKAASLKFAFNLFSAAERTAVKTEAFRMMNVSGTGTMMQPSGGTASGINTNIGLVEGTGTSTGLSSTSSALSIVQPGINRILLLIFLLEDFFDHLDVLIYNCKCSAFKAVKREYLKRLLYLTRLRQFGWFTRLHPGIQHKAGVPMGGTFLIVYHRAQREIKEGTLKGKFRIRGTVVDEEGEIVVGAAIRVQGTSKNLFTNASGNFQFSSTFLPLVLEVSFPGFDTQEITVSTEEPLKIVLGEERNEDVDVVDSIPEGTVIADFYLPYLCCSDCPPVQYVIEETTQPPPNQGPIANAGPDLTITLPTDTVTLNGSASTDPDGSITFFQWIKLSGPGSPEIVTPNSAQTAVKDLVEGVYQFELSVTDDKGAIARDTALVTVNPAPPPENQPPIADAGPDRTVTLSSTAPLILDGSASSDPDGSIVEFRWTMQSGPSTPVFISPNLVQTAVTNLVPGVYTFELTVKDNKGAEAKDTVVITVNRPPNQPPVANAGNDISITLPVNTVILTGSGSDPEGLAVTFLWKTVSKPAGAPEPNIANPQFAQTQVGPLVQGSYEFELTVTDTEGAATSNRVNVTVNRAPVVEKSCQPLKEIIDFFGRLRTVDPDAFPAFRDIFQRYREVEEYFKLLASERVAEMPIEKQIDFFATPFNQQLINQLLMLWLRDLNVVILERKDFRLLALTLYRILVQLAMYIVCIQKEDFDAGRIPMAEVFKLIATHVRRWAAIIQDFTPQQRDVVKKIGEDMKAEMARIAANGESATKPRYLAALKAIVELIDNIP